MVDDDDVHNPFGPGSPVKKAPKPGVFEPGFGKDDEDDPFHQPYDDGQWDEADEPESTRDA